MLTDFDEIPSIQLGDFTLKLEMDPPNAEMQEVARKELRETPEIQKEAIERLKELLQGIRRCVVRCENCIIGLCDF